MKIKVKVDPEVPEHEIHVHCRAYDAEVRSVIERLNPEKICGKTSEGDQAVVSLPAVYYFESVEKTVFAYTEKQVLETECRLCELETRCPAGQFFRISKTTMVNIGMITAIRPEEGRRLKLKLLNGEWLMVSRLYAAALKKQLKEGMK